MINLGIHILLVRSIDEYFNENEIKNNDLFFATGFTGSAGDALITLDKSFLITDSRYEIQSKLQSIYFDVIISKNETIEQCLLKKLYDLINLDTYLILININQVSNTLFKDIIRISNLTNLKIIESSKSLINSMKLKINKLNDKKKYEISTIKLKVSGLTVAEKISILNNTLIENKIDCFLLTSLEDIAWITNLRGNEFEFQSTFSSIAFILANRIIISFKMDPISIMLSKEIITINRSDFFNEIKKMIPSKSVIGLDSNLISRGVYSELKMKKFNLFNFKNPIPGEKSIKNKQEQKHMKESFAKTDMIMFNVKEWTINQFRLNNKLSEKIIYNFLLKSFLNIGIMNLSFNPCCAYGKNSSIIHYTLRSNDIIKNPSLFLLDIGAYYDGGYATDLTRTFFLNNEESNPTKKHKYIYTLVLKASIAGLSARVPRGIIGSEMDSIIRCQIKKYGFDYPHGTGHGIGINVHEKLPIISRSSNDILKRGYFFSIEPGIYIANWGGIRLENIVTLVDDPDNNDYLRVLPVTFSPFEENLIDYKLLTCKEKIFLKYFSDNFIRRSIERLELPPL